MQKVTTIPQHLLQGLHCLFFPKLNVPTSQSSAICPYLPETFPEGCHSPKVIAKKQVQLGIERFGELLCQFVFYINSVSSQWIWSISPETLVMHIISHHFRSNLLPFPATTKCRPSGHLPWFRGTRLHHEAQHISSQRLLSIRTWDRKRWFNIWISDLSDDEKIKKKNNNNNMKMEKQLWNNVYKSYLLIKNFDFPLPCFLEGVWYWPC